MTATLIVIAFLLISLYAGAFTKRFFGRVHIHSPLESLVTKTTS